jgi:hypothetical protein
MAKKQTKKESKKVEIECSCKVGFQCAACLE